MKYDEGKAVVRIDGVTLVLRPSDGILVREMSFGLGSMTLAVGSFALWRAACAERSKVSEAFASR
jgi:hypothetical protein